MALLNCTRQPLWMRIWPLSSTQGTRKEMARSGSTSRSRMAFFLYLGSFSRTGARECRISVAAWMNRLSHGAFFFRPSRTSLTYWLMVPPGRKVLRKIGLGPGSGWSGTDAPQDLSQGCDGVVLKPRTGRHDSSPRNRTGGVPGDQMVMGSTKYGIFMINFKSRFTECQTDGSTFAQGPESIATESMLAVGLRMTFRIPWRPE